MMDFAQADMDEKPVDPRKLRSSVLAGHVYVPGVNPYTKGTSNLHKISWI